MKTNTTPKPTNHRNPLDAITHCKESLTELIRSALQPGPDPFSNEDVQEMAKLYSRLDGIASQYQSELVSAKDVPTLNC